MIKTISKIKLTSVKVDKGKVEYNFDVSGELSRYVKASSYFINYSVNIESVPISVLTIAFVGNFLPLIIVFNAQVEVEEIDESFLKSVDDIKNGYQQMYPSLDVGGSIVYKKNVDSSCCVDEKKCGLLFSCGVDSTASLIKHIDEKPDLFSISGSDIDDYDEWGKIKDKINKVAHDYSLNCLFAESNFRSIYNYKLLDNYVSKYQDTFWHGFHHGIAIITHIAPIAYLKKYNKVYISSTFSNAMKCKYTCASAPSIDNHVRYANCCTVHDGYEMLRQDKIKMIVDYARNNKKHKIILRVCYLGGNVNCCSCEKCYRTALGIAAEGGDPNDFGFVWDKEHLKKCEYDMKHNILLSNFNIDYFYKPIQTSFINNGVKTNDYVWFINMNLRKVNWSLKKQFFRFMRYIKHNIFKL